MVKSLETVVRLKRKASGLKAEKQAKNPLGDVFQLLKMQSVFYTHSELTAPWGIKIPAMAQSLMFHIVLKGNCSLEVQGQTAVLAEGDFLIVPHGLGHSIFDHRSSHCVDLFELPLESLSDHYEVLHYGGIGDKTVLMCGAVSFTHPITTRLLSLMPQSVRINSGNSLYSQAIKNTIQMLANETINSSIGDEAIVTRLADILVIHTLRAWLDSQEAATAGWLVAFQDKRLGTAIKCMHHQPEHSWTVAQLAAEAGMSRTSFAEKFKRLVGESPLQYLTQWRMAMARSQLLHSKLNILEIALSVGYQSEAAFSRAYKKIQGVNPSTTRNTSMD